MNEIAQNQLVTVLKARQLGLTWLTVCYALWTMLFRPAATVLLFSKRDEEAIDLLNRRLKGVYSRLPRWMQATSVVSDSQHDWMLSNGSSAKSFPTTGGRSYTGSLVIVDEADFVQDLDGLMNAVKPTIDAGGQLILISSVDKSRPDSPFKRIYRGSVEGGTGWTGVFLPWSARPDRDQRWYEAQIADIQARTGALDDLHQEYPATDTEALAPRTLDKRIPAPWIEACFQPMRPGLPDGAPSLPKLDVYQPPVSGRLYVVGADPAEGNPTSDDSALTVMDALTGEEVACMAGKFDPSVFAGYAATLARYYNQAGIMAERNNHGHAVLLWLSDNARDLRLLNGRDGKPGWLSNSLGKTLMYDACADAFRDGDTLLHSRATYTQLASIEGASLRAPDGQHDDRADSYALAQVGRIVAINQPAARDLIAFG